MIEKRVSSLNAERHRIPVVPLEQTRQVHVADFRQAVLYRFQVLSHNGPISCEIESGGCPPWLQKRAIVSLAPMPILSEMSECLQDQRRISMRQQRPQHVFGHTIGCLGQLPPEEQVVCRPIPRKEFISSLSIQENRNMMLTRQAHHRPRCILAQGAWRLIMMKNEVVEIL